MLSRQVSTKTSFNNSIYIFLSNIHTLKISLRFILDAVCAFDKIFFRIGYFSHQLLKYISIQKKHHMEYSTTLLHVVSFILHYRFLLIILSFKIFAFFCRIRNSTLHNKCTVKKCIRICQEISLPCRDICLFAYFQCTNLII